MKEGEKKEERGGGNIIKEEIVWVKGSVKRRERRGRGGGWSGEGRKKGKEGTEKGEGESDERKYRRNRELYVRKERRRKMMNRIMKKNE